MILSKEETKVEVYRQLNVLKYNLELILNWENPYVLKVTNSIEKLLGEINLLDNDNSGIDYLFENPDKEKYNLE